jgi:excisionase family DNA binding protein
MRITLKGVTFYRSQEVATLLERSVYTIQKWCRQGRLDGARKIGRDLLIPERSVQKMKSVIRPRKLAEVSLS